MGRWGDGEMGRKTGLLCLRFLAQGNRYEDEFDEENGSDAYLWQNFVGHAPRTDMGSDVRAVRHELVYERLDKTFWENLCEHAQTHCHSHCIRVSRRRHFQPSRAVKVVTHRGKNHRHLRLNHSYCHRAWFADCQLGTTRAVLT